MVVLLLHLLLFHLLLQNRKSLLFLVFHDFFPLDAYFLVEFESRHGIVHGRMHAPLKVGGDAVGLAELFGAQVAQFARPPDAAAFLQKGFVLGRVAHVVPGMRQAQDLQIATQGMTDENFALQKFLHDGPNQVDRVRRLGLQKFGGNAADGGAIIGHVAFGPHVFVQQNLAVPIDETDARQDGMTTVVARADHFAIQSNVTILFFGRQGSRFGGLFAGFGSGFAALVIVLIGTSSTTAFRLFFSS